MPEYILICRDRENGFDLRSETRKAHLDYIDQRCADVLVAGPMLDDEGRSIGSILVIKAENMTEANAFAAGDPYAKAGLFAETEIRPFKVVTGTLVN
jgi:uncharacterized protein YciI